jgi:hypothetical protein
MRFHPYLVSAVVLTAAAAGWACSNDSVTNADRGTIAVRMKDAPFPSDSVDSVNVFVTKVEMRATAADSAAADSATSSTEAQAHGWVVVASPNRVYNLLALRNGIFAELGTTDVNEGSYTAMRLVIDPSRSNVRLKNGMILSGTTSPNVSFPSGSSSGIKVNFSGAINIDAGDTTTVMLDFDLDNSFVLRGNSITQLGLLFKPVIQASIQN